MYKALHRDTREEIVILHPHWRDEIPQLRSWDHIDILVCQRCSQPVRVKAGSIRRWHFAHKHLTNCPYSQETPTLIEARGVLYEWLIEKFPDNVTLEKMVSDSQLPRHVDCWAEIEGKTFAYWIFEAGMKPAIRDTLKFELQRNATHANWVFLSDMLRRDKHDDNRLHLTTTERDFLQTSEYDVPSHPSALRIGKTLNYLDSERQELLTFRNLLLYHSPQSYEGNVFQSNLSTVLMSPKSGEFVHQGEDEALLQYKEAKAEWERNNEHWTTGYRRTNSPTVPDGTDETDVDSSRRTSGRLRSRFSPPPANVWEKDLATCVFCGKQTTDWWTIDGATRTCKCNECLRNGTT